MEIGNNGAGLRQIRTLFSVGVVRDLTDGQLLERFATARGDSAELTFAELVERHGPMVLRVCRGVLDDPNDAQDAFQATFLVLVKKARTLWVRDSLGPWLYQVAYRTATRARSASARRRRLERAAASSPREPSRTPDEELALGLHEELAGLPERFRAPLVLCDLEGRTHEQAARHLGLPVGTVKSRQARGRVRLRDRLTRRGLSPRASLLGAVLIPKLSIPRSLVESTTAAVQFEIAHALSAGSAATLALSVLRTMSIARWFKTASALALSVTLTGVVALDQRPGPGKAAKASRPADAPPGNQPQGLHLRKDGTLVDAEAGMRTRKPFGPSEMRVSTGTTGPARRELPSSHIVKPDRLVINVSGRGAVESPSASVVTNRLRFSSPLLSILPEGTKVVKGQVVGELDPAVLRQPIDVQKSSTLAIRKMLEEANHEENSAKLHLAEYERLTSRVVKAKALEITKAETAIATTKGRIARTEQARDALGSLAKSETTKRAFANILDLLQLENRIDDDRRAIERGKSALDMARTDLDQVEMTRQRAISQLKLLIPRLEKARREREIAMESQLRAEASLDEEVKSCTLRAPNDGVVGYAALSNDVALSKGVEIRPEQEIFSVLDSSRPVLINATFAETPLGRVVPGLKVQVKVDALPNESLTGVVEVVAPKVFGHDSVSESGRPYWTKIKLDQDRVMLRPGMTAEVIGTVTELENVLSVPVGMVSVSEGKDYLDVKGNDGKIERREVKLGVNNGTFIEVKEGLKAGDVVVPLAVAGWPPLKNKPKVRTFP